GSRWRARRSGRGSAPRRPAGSAARAAHAGAPASSLFPRSPAPGDEDPVAEQARLERGARRAEQLAAAADPVDAEHARRLQPGLDAVEERSEGVVVCLRLLDAEAGLLEQGGGLVKRAGAGEAGDPGLERGERVGELVGAGGQVGEGQARARPEHARELARGGRLVGEGAERALAEGAVDARAGERERLRVAAQEAHARIVRRVRGRGEVDADDLAAGLAGELQRARPGAAGDVEDEV